MINGTPWFFTGIERVIVDSFKSYELTRSENNPATYILKHDGNDIAHIAMFFTPTGLIMNPTKEKEVIPDGLLNAFKEAVEEANRDAYGLE